MVTIALACDMRDGHERWPISCGSWLKNMVYNMILVLVLSSEEVIFALVNVLGPLCDYYYFHEMWSVRDLSWDPSQRNRADP